MRTASLSSAAAMRSEERLRAAEAALREKTFTPRLATLEELHNRLGVAIASPTTAFKLLQRKDLTASRLASVVPELLDGLDREELSVLESRIRYEGYILRERERLERARPFESRPIPSNFRYEGLPGLSIEVIEQCTRRRPRTVGEASRIPGVTPAAVAIISAHVARAGGSPSA